jgi:hypothetical protein
MFRIIVRTDDQVLVTDYCTSLGCACKAAFRWLQLYPGAVFDVDDPDGRRIITAGAAVSTVAELFDQVKAALAERPAARRDGSISALAMAVDVLSSVGLWCRCGHTHQPIPGGWVMAYCNVTSCWCVNYDTTADHG